jgi:hypothetical protein
MYLKVPDQLEGKTSRRGSLLAAALNIPTLYHKVPNDDSKLDRSMLNDSSISARSCKSAVSHEDMGKAIASGHDRLVTFKRQPTVYNYQEARADSMRLKGGIVSNVWVDPEVLEDPFYVDSVIHFRKKRITLDGVSQTIKEIRIKRKPNLYDKFDSSLLVVPKPSSARLVAYLSPIKEARKTLTDISLKAKASKLIMKREEGTIKQLHRRVQSLPRTFARLKRSPTVNKGSEARLPKTLDETASNLRHFKPRDPLTATALTSSLFSSRPRNQAFQAKIQSRTLESLIARRRLLRGKAVSSQHNRGRAKD